MDFLRGCGPAIKRACDHDAGVGGVEVKVVAEAGVEHNAAVIFGGVEEAKRAAGVAVGEADVGAVFAADVGGDGDDVAGLQARFDRGNAIFGDVVDGKGLDALFDEAHLGNEAGVVAQVGVDVGGGGHGVDFFEQGNATEFAGDVAGDAFTFGFDPPFGEVMDAGEVGAVAAAAAVAEEFDLAKEVCGLPGAGVVFGELGQAEGDFEECPAVYGFQVDAGGFDGVVDFECPVFVGGVE